MRSYLILLVIAITFFSCQNSKSDSFISKPGEVPAQEYTIDITKDTVLVAKNGTKFNIPAGGLKSSSNKVTLEVKEAVSIEQIIRSGLTTKSADNILSSGGMLYFNAKKGQDVTIAKPIGVSLPTKFIEENMKLYKGESTADGKINWKDTMPLSPNPELLAIKRGKILFDNNCSGCHNATQKVTGPELYDFKRRFKPRLEKGDRWYYALHFSEAKDYYTADSSNHMNSSFSFFDKIYSCNLLHIWAPIVGTAFPALSDSAKDAIYTYLENEGDKKGLLPRQTGLLENSVDSCMQYLKAIDGLLEKKMKIHDKRTQLVKENGKMVEVNSNTLPTTIIVDSIEAGDIDPAYILPVSHYSTYYQFTINAFGWYNIDILIEGLDGVIESNLLVTIAGEDISRTQLYFIIPSKKVFVEGGESDKGQNTFAFKYKDGSIQLPQGELAYILALNETGGKISYAMQKFSTRQSQQFTLSLKETTKENFNQVMKEISKFDLEVNVHDSKNATAIRKTDADLKSIERDIQKADSLKPKNCNCDCYPVME